MATERPRPHQNFHLLEAWNVPDVLFTDPILFKATSVQMAEAVGLTILGRPSFHQYDPESISLNAFLSESSINAHTWKELNNYMNFVLHTCSREIDFGTIPDIAREILQTDEIEFRPLTPHGRRMKQIKSGLVIPA